jgi:hypothetical protein
MTESNPSDSEIEKLVAQAGIALQGLQEILGRTERDAGKVRFPRGFLHPASKWRNRLSFIRQKTVKWERKGVGSLCLRTISLRGAGRVSSNILGHFLY